MVGHILRRLVFRSLRGTAKRGATLRRDLRRGRQKGPDRRVPAFDRISVSIPEWNSPRQLRSV